MNSKPIQSKFSVGFQLKFCSLLCVLLLLSSYSLYYFLDKSLTGDYLESVRTLYFLNENIPFYLSVIALLQVLFVLVLTLVVILLASHKIAGPIYRYEEFFNSIAKGEIPAGVATRSGDQLKGTIAPLNDLSRRWRQIYDRCQSLKESGEELLKSPNSGNQAALEKHIDAVRLAMMGAGPGDHKD
jgi:hypothetical protein